MKGFERGRREGRRTRPTRPLREALESRVVLNASPAVPGPPGLIAALEVPFPFPIPELPIPFDPGMIPWPPKIDLPIPDLPIPDLSDPCNPIYEAAYRVEATGLALAVQPISPTGAAFIRHFLDGSGTAMNTPAGVPELVEGTGLYQAFRGQVIENLESAVKAAGTASVTVPRFTRPGSFRFGPSDSLHLFGAYAGTRGTFADYANVRTTPVDTDGDGFSDAIDYQADVTYTILDRFVIDRGDLFGDRIAGFMLKLQACGDAAPFDTNIEFTRQVSGRVEGGEPLDLVFVIDTTGSMADDIAAVKASAAELIATAKSNSPSVRFGLVTFRDAPIHPYGDPGDYQARVDLALTSDAAGANAAIQSITVGGGADWPESVYSGLRQAFAMGGWRPEARRVVILMGDAPPQDPEPLTRLTGADIARLSRAVDVEVRPRLMAATPLAAAAGAEVSVFTIVIGSDRDAIAAYARIAEENRGEALRSDGAGDIVDRVTSAIVLGARSTSGLSLAAEAPALTRARSLTRFTFLASSLDGGADDDFIYAIDWDGDGTVDQTIEGGAVVEVDHRFESDGSRAVTARVTRRGDRAASAVATVVVRAASVALLPDPSSPLSLVLYVDGSDGADSIRILRAGAGFQVIVNGVIHETGRIPSRIVVEGHAGDDTIEIDRSVNVPVLVRGGDGADRLIGSGGAPAMVLVGDAGDDAIILGGRPSPGSRAIAIGGAGSDVIDATHREALVATGPTIHDGDDSALFAILGEWTSRRPLATRLRNLQGRATLRAWNLPYFLRRGAEALDDGQEDRVHAGRQGRAILRDPGDRLLPAGTATTRRPRAVVPRRPPIPGVGAALRSPS